ncbi:MULTISPECIES: hypothetical protein [unclassified Pseudomonas]|uniref:hypothetical protein n=1 Tax=unclassified Pseudomonas TaxID=196821 RepID=UPI000270BC59|nr:MULTISPECIES: hypothetical protein [unclassified Pseudomonas]EJM83797.1 hypothetical protein PMI33_04165 [Pseudomonas sp. GM67]MBD9546836.1 hypothetical protein [Pseudomonas sp. PDM01]
MNDINTETSPVDKDSILLGLAIHESIIINGTKHIVAGKFYHWHSDDQNARYTLEVKLFSPAACTSVKTDKPVSTAKFSTHANQGDYVFIESTEGYHTVTSKQGNISNAEYTITVSHPLFPVFP